MTPPGRRGHRGSACPWGHLGAPPLDPYSVDCRAVSLDRGHRLSIRRLPNRATLGAQTSCHGTHGFGMVGFLDALIKRSQVLTDVCSVVWIRQSAGGPRIERPSGLRAPNLAVVGEGAEHSITHRGRDAVPVVLVLEVVQAMRAPD
jgi:hypothetical protein